ncbi:MAG TPA: glycosyltransferase [bacterium]|uniref:Undecaprenyldiphospho-muramoylpentapeptide beta-N-acetylglucosaminyltransferase n=1 Tax=candidate division TA06 bacterium ADurb.Bin417 TaxID=1852828 RepID=A0A1V5MIS0_UNCT6|nr:MAG: undecaprenyldiphospho-muramoylpentapeptide beta-N- acetylglucosaminyltransferase [candidate division TA06 bacterium ADurb.Bin417]HNQ35034.1 glycosyltransferase [bacterium]HNS49180.1 glycosyltransferase [bacterium]
MSRILVSPLSWGLGHATRDIPIIRELLEHGHRVSIAGSGRAMELLKQEFPHCDFFELEDYPPPYTATRYFLAKFIAYIPLILHAIRLEHESTRRLLAEHPCDLIISDNRFGVHAPGVPSFFISHQLRFYVPDYLRPGGYISARFNSSCHRNFRRVIVPDNPPEKGSLSGLLSENRFPATQERLYYAGILSSVDPVAAAEDIDYLISISGPEPQRSKLEELVLQQAAKLPGRKVILLGLPAETRRFQLDERTEVRNHATREEMAALMSRAKFIITRSGYTTMMELAELGKRRALLIPTPGQTEQEYLSLYYQQQGWFYSQSQYRLDLVRDIQATSDYRGFPAVTPSRENARRLYRELFAPHLD